MSTNSSIDKDIWFSGVGDTLSDGNITYFICEYRDKFHYDEAAKDFSLYCNYKKKPLKDLTSECTMDCDMYGRCQNCNGFSAVRCSECFIPRP